MKLFSAVLVVVWLLLLLAPTVFGQDSPPQDQSSDRPVVGRSVVSEERQSDNPVGEEEATMVEMFFNDPGLQLIPPTKNIPVIRNVFRNKLYYNSNIFLTEHNPDSAVVYELDFSSNFRYQTERLIVDIIGGVSYEYIFEDDNIDEHLPYIQLDAQYKEDLYYLHVNNHFHRYSTITSLELNRRSPWHQNAFTAQVGFTPQRWLIEFGFSHSYVDFREIRGDYLRYGPEFVVGYEVGKKAYITVEYSLDYIDYREAVIIDGRKQRDSFGHSYSVGLHLDIARTIKGRIRTGFDYRESKAIWSFSGNLTWYALSQLQVDFQVFRGFKSSLFSRYQVLTSATLAGKYVFTPDFATKASITVAHSNPDHGESSAGFYGKLEFIYRLMRGIDLEIFYQVDVVRSKAEGGDYDRHLAGGAIAVIF